MYTTLGERAGYLGYSSEKVTSGSFLLRIAYLRSTFKNNILNGFGLFYNMQQNDVIEA